MKNSVKVERVKKEITQEKLAELVGVSRQTISLLESGKDIPSTLLAMKISFVFQVPVNEIFDLEENDWC
jgi:putative transcriptional regulator